MGILGCDESLRIQLTTRGRGIRIPSGEAKRDALIYLLPIPYDENLPTYFTRVYTYLTKCARDHPQWMGFRYIPSCPEGYCEKIEMKWFPVAEIRKTVPDAGPDTDPNADPDARFRRSFLQSMSVILRSAEGRRWI